MLFADGALGLLLFGLWIFCIIDVITTPEGDCRNLPKVVWLLIVLLLPDIGAIVWLVAGRNWNRGPADLPYKGNRGNRVDRATRDDWRRDSRPLGRPGRPGGTVAPDDDEEFLAGLRARAEEQRRRAREAQPPEDPATS
jgi:hypothetical protein